MIHPAKMTFLQQTKCFKLKRIKCSKIFLTKEVHQEVVV